MTQEKKQIVNDLIDIDNYIWGKYGYTCRPAGYEYIELVLNIADQIAYRFNPDIITDDIQEVLTNENYHTLNHAIDIVKHVNKYA